MKYNKLYMNLFVFDANTQTTDLPGLSPEMKTYYEKRLIDLAQPKLIHDQFADKYPIPKNGGKTIEFRKYSPLAKATTPITEGVTPPGNKLNVTAMTATVDQYGDWIGMSDIFETTAIDNNVVQATKLLASQAGRTLDSITRDVMNGGQNVRYAPAIGSDGTETPTGDREDITATCVLTPKLIFQAKADLAAMNADLIDDSYVGIIHPFAAFDLMRNEEWIDVHKYADPEKIYDGEIGKLGGVRFVENSEAKIFAPAFISDEVCRVTVKTNTTSSTSVVINETLTSGTYTSKPIPVYCDGTANTITAITTTGNDDDGYTTTLTLGTAASLTAGDLICGQGGGTDGSAVFSTLILGAHAYGTTELEGGGLQHIVKPLGYGDDPLNQRASCGWKATKVAKRLVEAYMVRIESGGDYSPDAVPN